MKIYKLGGRIDSTNTSFIQKYVRLPYYHSMNKPMLGSLFFLKYKSLNICVCARLFFVKQ